RFRRCGSARRLRARRARLQRSKGVRRPPRVPHGGKRANNGYLNAKLQRRVGVPADAVCDEWHMISQPEWEDAPLEPVSDPLAPLMGKVGWGAPGYVLSTRERHTG